MRQGTACEHKPRPAHIVVTMRCYNRSAVNGYRWTPSDYSEVRCLTCGARWRTKAAWVDTCRDATEEQDIGANPKPLTCECGEVECSGLTCDPTQ